MAGLVPAIHVFLAHGSKDVDARHPSPPRLRRATISPGRRSVSEDGKAGHDELEATHVAPSLEVAIEKLVQAAI